MSPFDAYRDPEARKLMIDFVCHQRRIMPPRAVAALRELNHVGLAYIYRDAVRSTQYSANEYDYDPCAVR
jgi:hypothetical protein